MPTHEYQCNDARSDKPLKVSVIIPARNEETFLASCLAAAQAQDFTDGYEIIVVDNGSTDRTAEIAAAQGARVVYEAEPGSSRAREAGRKAARADILLYIDADTCIPPHYITKVVETFERNQQVVSVTSPVRFYDGNWSANIFIFCYFHFYRLLNWLRLTDFIFGGTFALRREAIERIGGFDVSFVFYGDETDLTKRIAREGAIRYLGNLYSLTSARRYQREGTFTTVWHYTLNYFSVQLFNRPYVSRQQRSQHAWRFGTILFLVLSLFLYAFAFPESELFGKVVYKVASPQKAVALTFDDGSNDDATAAVLRVLAAEHVKATFFVTGENAVRHPELAAEIVREGHVIGNHSYRHSWSLPFQSRKSVLEEVRKADVAIYRATNIHTRLFRPPHGLRTPWMLSAIRDDGYTVVMWDDMTDNFLGATDPNSIADHILNQVHPSSIIALDDGATSHHPAANTAAALRMVIRELKRQHYTFVTLGDTE